MRLSFFCLTAFLGTAAFSYTALAAADNVPNAPVTFPTNLPSPDTTERREPSRNTERYPTDAVPLHSVSPSNERNTAPGVVFTSQSPEHHEHVVQPSIIVVEPVPVYTVPAIATVPVTAPVVTPVPTSPLPTSAPSAPAVAADSSAAHVLWYEADPRNNPRTDFTPTNVWASDVYRVTAGYSPANPSRGQIMLEDLRQPGSPLVIPTPTSTGPVRVESVDFSYGVPSKIVMKSQQGSFAFHDGSNPNLQVVNTTGGTIYIYDVIAQKFTN